MSRFNRFFVSFGIAAVMMVAIVAVVRGSGPVTKDGWNLSCLDLNDLVEEHWLDRPENVGIYINAFEIGAEAACRVDHRSDVETLFWWAFTPVDRIHHADPRYNPAASISSGESIEISGHSSIRSKIISLPAGQYLATTTWRDSEAARLGRYVGLDMIGVSDSEYVTEITLASSPAVSGAQTTQFEIFDPATRFFIIASDYLLEEWNVSFKRVS